MAWGPFSLPGKLDAGYVTMPSKPENRKVVERYGKGTALIIFGGLGVMALVDQVIVPETEINPVIYGIMAGVGIGAYPGIKGLTGK